MDIKKVKLDFKEGKITIYSTPLAHLIKTYFGNTLYDIEIYEDDED